MEHITPLELSRLLNESDADLQLIDVRERDEVELCCVDGALNIPLSEFESRYGELDTEQAYALLCHHGMRSMRAALFLEQAGFARLYNVSGGIDRWALEIDPDMPRY